MFGLNNPQGLLRPWKNLTQFTEELYAMFSSREPIEREGPVTIRVREGQTALRIERSGTDPVQSSPTTLRARPLPQPVPPTFESPATANREASVRDSVTIDDGPGAVRQPSDSVFPPPVTPAAPLVGPPPPAPPMPPIPQAMPAQQPPPYQPPPLLAIAGSVSFEGSEPVRFQTPPQMYDPIKQDWFTPPAFKLPDLDGIPAIGGGMTAFIGIVTSGSGDTYEVVLYPDGLGGEPGDSVTVKIPIIADDEVLDPGTVLFPIFQIGESYIAQPPVWMN